MSEGDDENAQERLPEDQLKVNLPQAARHIKYPELKLPEFSAILSTGDSWSTVYQLSLRLAPNTLREWENHSQARIVQALNPVSTRLREQRPKPATKFFTLHVSQSSDNYSQVSAM
ncbi:hypothetical protein pipiens_012701 [Culex pipiens pipiens]|uniref:Uncharacterized protein n=1 Tax=Culex pipiens pipiens TaxID=38569 RepID=A0ABD1D1A9_CULPP